MAKTGRTGQRLKYWVFFLTHKDLHVLGRLQTPVSEALLYGKQHNISLQFSDLMVLLHRITMKYPVSKWPTYGSLQPLLDYMYKL